MLRVVDLTIRTQGFSIIKNVSFEMEREKVKVVLGESGAGKSTLGLFLSGVLKEGLTWEGEIYMEGKAVNPLEKGWAGRVSGLVLQDPYSSFDPRKRILNSVAEPIRYHTGVSGKEAKEIAELWLKKVGFPSERFRHYPHQLSGGLLQRAAIASALSLEPKILVADEPTSALDPPLRAGIRELIKEFSRGRYVLYITHFVEDALFFGQDFLILYEGMVMEEGPSLLHPYSKLLLSSVVKRGEDIPEVEGFSPHPSALPEGCPFRPRCPLADRQCFSLPPMRQVGENRLRCWHVP